MNNMKASTRFTQKARAVMGAAAALAGMGFTQGSMSAYASTAPNVQQSVDSIVNPYVSNGSFSGAILLEKHGTVLVDKGYGLSNVATSEKMTTYTRFAIGSLTQTFTAVAIMQLKEKGLLSLKDPLSKFISSDNTVAQNITVGELLTHTSGAPTSPDAHAAFPGTVFQYSPLNYVIAGKVIQAITGQSAASYIQQNILNPLGMSDTGFITSSLSAVQNAATGYVNTNNQVSAVDYSPGPLVGADDMYSTVNDLYKWDQALYSGKILSAEDIKQLYLPTTLSVQALNTYGYGLGWEVSLDSTSAEVQSAVGGFEIEFYRDMVHDETLIILSNRRWAPIIDMSHKLMTVLSQAQVPSPTLSSIVGGEKAVVVNGNMVSKPNIRVAQDTAYMPIWYVGQALQSLGIKQSWDGQNHVWNLSLPPSFKTDFSKIDLGTGNTDIVINGQLVKRINTYGWLDPATGNKSYTTYTPIYYIQQLLTQAGVTNTWNGQAWLATTH